ncbi:MAG: penicillin-binding protein activator [Gammaproteobacteria bacterium]|nr:penicillin-binding protein activator [Gammaproteobacteria bacterium]
MTAPIPASSVISASAKIERGDFEGAAADLVAAAATPNIPAADTRLRAALIYFDLNDLKRARELAPDQDHTPNVRRAFITTLLAPPESSAANKLAELNALDSRQFDPFEKGLYLRTLGRVQLALDDDTAVVNLLNSELLPLARQRRTELTHLIWDSLVKCRDLAQLDRADTRNQNVAGWRALLNETRTQAGAPQMLAEHLSQWRLAYPQHPANEILVDELVERAEEAAKLSKKIALLLPFNGELAAFARAIRDGFIAMRFAAHDQDLTITTYPAFGADVRNVYAQAVADGADMIVGPLDKLGVESLHGVTERKVPILALNVATQTTPPAADVPAGARDFIQFALRPEDEAQDLADRAWGEGRRRMATIVPNTDLGTRAQKTFSDQWQRRGGVVAGAATYNSSVASYQAAIKQTFSLADSESRANALRKLLQRPITFVAQSRPDLDAIMLVAQPEDGRQILPQFRYYGVDNLPIYATSQLFSGTVSPRADQDLDGVMLGCMPWIIGIEDRELRRLIAGRWTRSGRDLDRFYAFGIDAYRLVKLLPQMRVDPSLNATGATGRLSLDRTGTIHRTLTWAKFSQGVPRPLRDLQPHGE